ncbi:MAG TPA: primosomal protein N' [Rhodospirillaceae bacterium]|nr:primosomal protein N' [Rhodospirillaceae bacterium]
MPFSLKESKMPICSVLVTSPVEKAYDYLIPEGMELGVGDYVTVPLGSRTVHGVVWAVGGAGEVASSRLKAVLQKHDLPPMDDTQMKFIDWVASYNMERRGSVLKMALSVPQALEPSQPMTGYVLGTGEYHSDKTQKVIDLMQDGLPRRLSEITQATDSSASTVKTMVKHGVLQAVDIFAKAPCATPNPNFSPKDLTPEQEKAADKIIARIDQGGFESFLLDGVTGSGKTEVYFEAIAKIISERRGQVLILMPEIALSNSFIRRFAERFGVKPALWHSSLTPAQRRLTWRSIVTGQTKVVVGARSALFLPYADLKLIVVDEEHDPAFKQEEVTIYHARDMAVVRAHQGKIPIILASATPSLETMQNVWEGRYTLLSLPDRFGGASKPDIRIIDMRLDKPERQHFMSPKLIDEVRKTLDAKQQALLFLNRRGFAPLTLCRTCGHRMECPKCTAWLVEHKRGQQLQCHHCGFSIKTPHACVNCHDVDSLVACGPGVERIAEEVKEYFPDARPLILASDITDTHDKLIAALDSIKNHEVDIIIGTQIIAKGHHFPHITCVGIIDADLGLSGGDLRATERSYQLLHQVAGRAGREQLKGHVYLQTYNAEQRVMQMIAEDDRDGFLEAEADERQTAKMPPFSRLAALVISGKNETQTKDVAMMIGRAAPRAEGVQILGPAPAQMYRIRGNFRQRILIRAEKNLNIQKLIAEWLDALKIPSAVRVVIDIDPQNFL